MTDKKGSCNTGEKYYHIADIKSHPDFEKFKEELLSQYACKDTSVCPPIFKPGRCTPCNPSSPCPPCPPCPPPPCPKEICQKQVEESIRDNEKCCQKKINEALNNERIKYLHATEKLKNQYIKEYACPVFKDNEIKYQRGFCGNPKSQLPIEQHPDFNKYVLKKAALSKMEELKRKVKEAYGCPDDSKCPPDYITCKEATCSLKSQIKNLKEALDKKEIENKKLCSELDQANQKCDKEKQQLQQQCQVDNKETNSDYEQKIRSLQVMLEEANKNIQCCEARSNRNQPKPTCSPCPVNSPCPPCPVNSPVLMPIKDHPDYFTEIAKYACVDNSVNPPVFRRCDESDLKGPFQDKLLEIKNSHQKEIEDLIKKHQEEMQALKDSYQKGKSEFIENVKAKMAAKLGNIENHPDLHRFACVDYSTCPPRYYKGQCPANGQSNENAVKCETKSTFLDGISSPSSNQKGGAEKCNWVWGPIEKHPDFERLMNMYAIKDGSSWKRLDGINFNDYLHVNQCKKLLCQKEKDILKKLGSIENHPQYEALMKKYACSSTGCGYYKGKCTGEIDIKDHPDIRNYISIDDHKKKLEEFKKDIIKRLGSIENHPQYKSLMDKYACPDCPCGYKKGICVDEFKISDHPDFKYYVSKKECQAMLNELDKKYTSTMAENSINNCQKISREDFINEFEKYKQYVKRRFKEEVKKATKGMIKLEEAERICKNSLSEIPITEHPDYEQLMNTYARKDGTTCPPSWKPCLNMPITEHPDYEDLMRNYAIRDDSGCSPVWKPCKPCPPCPSPKPCPPPPVCPPCPPPMECPAPSPCPPCNLPSPSYSPKTGNWCDKKESPVKECNTKCPVKVVEILPANCKMAY